MLRRTLHSLKKSRMFVNATSKGSTSNNELDKDTDRSNLNSKVNYISLALPLNVSFLLLVNTCKVRFGVSYIITIISVQAIVNVDLLFAWICICLVEDVMNNV